MGTTQEGVYGITEDDVTHTIEDGDAELHVGEEIPDPAAISGEDD